MPQDDPSLSHLSLSDARRIALAAQGFDRPRPHGRVGAHHLRRTIRQLQIDYVNVLVPAHYLVLFSRLSPYQRSLLDDLYRRRELTEQWAHEASILPVESWPLLRHRMETHRVRPYGFERFLEQNPGYAGWVVDQVRVPCRAWRDPRSSLRRGRRCPRSRAADGGRLAGARLGGRPASEATSPARSPPRSAPDSGSEGVKKELGEGLLREMCRDLEIEKQDLF